MMRRMTRHRWLSEDRFLDLLGATNLDPRPQLDRDGDPHQPGASPVMPALAWRS